MADAYLSVKFVPPTDLLDAYREQEQDLGKLATTTFRRRYVKARPRILRILRIVPGAAHHPIRWTTARQRRAFFASDGFGRGIPTVRTNAYVDAFEVEIETTDFTGVISVTNTDPGAPYIGGDLQQGFHVDTGWTNINAAMDEEDDLLEAELTNDYFLLADPEALTR